MIPAAHQLFIDGADAVAEHVHLQLLSGRKARPVAVGPGNGQRGLIGILINEIAEGVEAGGLQRPPEDVQMGLSVFKQVKAQIPIVFALLGGDVIIQKMLVVLKETLLIQLLILVSLFIIMYLIKDIIVGT